ncbi:hypothetical protein C923_04644 [Plasmodium falciparum UGT5.1]|uniref:Uncharacterized protein n=1 Tax=Plasmodium falciparum UGT5.1 TaxID=1237627 RepID=W7JIN8_PLAFA|nr:hypothetical protein C923_04644 [Plasmodium falciparum UGT5.1]
MKSFYKHKQKKPKISSNFKKFNVDNANEMKKKKKKKKKKKNI